MIWLNKINSSTKEEINQTVNSQFNSEFNLETTFSTEFQVKQATHPSQANVTMDVLNGLINVVQTFNSKVEIKQGMKISVLIG